MIRKKSMGPCIIWLTFLVVWLLMVQSSVFAEHGLRHDYPDVFAREDIRIESGQVIGSLLVTGANATVSGVVEKGMWLAFCISVLMLGERRRLGKTKNQTDMKEGRSQRNVVW